MLSYFTADESGAVPAEEGLPERGAGYHGFPGIGTKDFEIEGLLRRVWGVVDRRLIFTEPN